eukprot:COSAG04_NODE_1104_length_8239_cov_19.226658_3_plen_75_part_00
MDMHLSVTKQAHISIVPPKKFPQLPASLTRSAPLRSPSSLRSLLRASHPPPSALPRAPLQQVRMPTFCTAAATR